MSNPITADTDRFQKSFKVKQNEMPIILNVRNGQNNLIEVMRISFYAING